MTSVKAKNPSPAKTDKAKSQAQEQKQKRFDEAQKNQKAEAQKAQANEAKANEAKAKANEAKAKANADQAKPDNKPANPLEQALSVFKPLTKIFEQEPAEPKSPAKSPAKPPVDAPKTGRQGDGTLDKFLKTGDDAVRVIKPTDAQTGEAPSADGGKPSTATGDAKSENGAPAELRYNSRESDPFRALTDLQMQVNKLEGSGAPKGERPTEIDGRGPNGLLTEAAAKIKAEKLKNQDDPLALDLLNSTYFTVSIGENVTQTKKDKKPSGKLAEGDSKNVPAVGAEVYIPVVKHLDNARKAFDGNLETKDIPLGTVMLRGKHHAVEALGARLQTAFEHMTGDVKAGEGARRLTEILGRDPGETTKDPNDLRNVRSIALSSSANAQDLKDIFSSENPGEAAGKLLETLKKGTEVRFPAFSRAVKVPGAGDNTANIWGNVGVGVDKNGAPEVKIRVGVESPKVLEGELFGGSASWNARVGAGVTGTLVMIKDGPNDEDVSLGVKLSTYKKDGSSPIIELPESERLKKAVPEIEKIIGQEIPTVSAEDVDMSYKDFAKKVVDTTNKVTDPVGSKVDEFVESNDTLKGFVDGAKETFGRIQENLKSVEDTPLAKAERAYQNFIPELIESTAKEPVSGPLLRAAWETMNPKLAKAGVGAYVVGQFNHLANGPEARRNEVAKRLAIPGELTESLTDDQLRSVESATNKMHAQRDSLSTQIDSDAGGKVTDKSYDAALDAFGETRDWSDRQKEAFKALHGKAVQQFEPNVFDALSGVGPNFIKDTPFERDPNIETHSDKSKFDADMVNIASRVDAMSGVIPVDHAPLARVAQQSALATGWALDEEEAESITVENFITSGPDALVDDIMMSAKALAPNDDADQRPIVDRFKDVGFDDRTADAAVEAYREAMITRRMTEKDAFLHTVDIALTGFHQNTIDLRNDTTKHERAGIRHGGNAGGYEALSAYTEFQRQNRALTNTSYSRHS